MNNTTQNQAAGINDDKVIMKQNFPNPVSDQTNIEFITLEKSNIAIDLFDNTGVFVESLYNKYTDKGSQVIGYSSKNLSPGIYFYTIYSNGTKICSKKMIVD
jgi:hypothetical protein